MPADTHRFFIGPSVNANGLNSAQIEKLEVMGKSVRPVPGGLQPDTGKLFTFKTEFQPFFGNTLECLTGLSEVPATMFYSTSPASDFLGIFMDLRGELVFHFVGDVTFIDLAIEAVQSTRGR